MERIRLELMPGVFFTWVSRRDEADACFRAALLRQLDREEAAMNALLPEALLQGTQRHPGKAALTQALEGLGCRDVQPLVRKIGEVQAVGYEAVFENSPASFAALMQTLSAVLLSPDTRFGQLKKEAVAEALARRDEAEDCDDPFGDLIAHMCCYEDYAVPVLGERPEAGPNYYQKLSKHYRAVLSVAPLELYYAGAVGAKEAAQILSDCFAAMPRGEPDFELGTDIRMNAVEAEPRLEDHSGPQGAYRVGVGWRLGDAMEEPDPPTLEALAGLLAHLTRDHETQVRLDVHKGILLAQCDVNADDAEQSCRALQSAMDAIGTGSFTQEDLDQGRAARVTAIRAAAQDPRALEAYWLEQDLLGLELAPDEYAAFTQEVTPQDVRDAAQGVECDAILIQ